MPKLFTPFIACRGSILLLLVAVLFAISPANAQIIGDTSALYGSVRDPSDAAVPGAQVVAKNTLTGQVRKTVTTQSGDFALENLAKGVYVVTVQAAGFKTFNRENIELSVAQRSMLNAVLEVGNVAEHVVVRAETQQIETSRPTLQSVINQKQVVELPLQGRNVLDLTLLAPGVQTADGSFMKQVYTAPNQVFISSSGGRANTTVYNLDGVDNSDTYTNVSNSYPNPDALEALNIETNSFSAENGRRSGAVVNAVTKSGTNDFHGSAFEFVRNYNLNATNYFTPGRPDFLKRHQFGGTVGGPVFKDKTFFFASYQRTTLRQLSSFQTVIVPTAAMKNGDFSNLKDSAGRMIQLKDPVSGQPFPNNQIDSRRFDPIAMGVLKYIPTPTDPSGALLISRPNRFDDDQIVTRVDHTLSAADRLSARVVYDRQNSGVPVPEDNILIAAFKVDYRTANISLWETHIFTPHLLGVFSATLNRLWSASGADYPATFQTLGANIVDLAPRRTMEVSVGNFFALPRLDPVILVRNNYQFQGALTYMTGRHEVKFGVDVMRQQFNVPIAALVSNGLFTFTNQFSGSNLSDYMLGKSSLFIQSTGWGEALRATQPAFYVQDRYKARQHLTFDFGLRWEPYLPWVDHQANKTLKWVPGRQSTKSPGLPPGIVIAGEQGVPDGAQNVAIRKLAPRLGFAYVLPDEKTTIRGGYGLYYDYPNAVINNRFASNVPFVVRTDIANPTSMTSPWTAAQPNPFPAKIPAPSGFVFARPVLAVTYGDDFTNSYLQQWNVTIERQLKPNWVARASYVGSKGTKLLSLTELNPARYIAGASTLANINSRRIYAPDFASVQSLTSDGNSIYNALTLTLDKKWANGFMIETNYTYGKSIDYQSNIVAHGQNTYTNPSNFTYDRGLSDFDHAHRLVGTFIYEIPAFRRAAPALRHTLGGWQLNSIFMLQSGSPLTIYSGSDRSLDGVGGDRPDLVGNPTLDTGRSKAQTIAAYFDTGAFKLNGEGTYGSAGRNIVRGPGFSKFDFSLFKNIPIRERYNLQFRAEAFNAFNRTNFSNPNTTFTSSLFGKITTAAEARILQLALRITF